MTISERFGAHGLIWVNQWSDDDAKLTVESARAAGLHHVEIPLFDPWNVDAATTRELLDRNGLTATCSVALSPSTDVSSEDGSVVAAGERLLSQALEVTHELGVKHLCGVYYSALLRYPHPPTAKGRANSVAVTKDAGQQAKRLGIDLVLEVVNKYETNLLNTAEDALRFIDDTGLDNAFVHLDTYHMNMEERDMYRPVLTCGDRLGYLHLRESNSAYLGTGTVDFPSLFRALSDIGYGGLVTFEAFTYSRASAELRDLLCVWRDGWDDPDDIVRHAKNFAAVHAV